MTLYVATTLQQWVLFVGTVVAVGCVSWTLYVAPRTSRSVPMADRSAVGGIERRVASTGIAASVVLVLAWVARGGVQLAAFRDPFVPISEDISFLLFDLFWGAIWMGQGVVVLLLLLAFVTSRPPADAESARPPGRVVAARWLAGVLSLFLVASLAMSSHAMGVDTWRSLAVAADGLHLLAAGTWIGALGVILLAGRGAGRPLFAAQIRAFSPLAMASVAILVVMGVALSWTHLQSVSDLWTGTYGRVLSGKVITAGVVLLAGLWNWRRGIPSLAGDVGASRVRRGATVEVSVALGVLLLTAVLVHSAKP